MGLADQSWYLARGGSPLPDRTQALMKEGDLGGSNPKGHPMLYTGQGFVQLGIRE